MNRNWVIFVLHQKRKLALKKEIESPSENAPISRLGHMISRLIDQISRLIHQLSRLL